MAHLQLVPQPIDDQQLDPVAELVDARDGALRLITNPALSLSGQHAAKGFAELLDLFIESPRSR
jgi:hypothetical protein